MPCLQVWPIFTLTKSVFPLLLTYRRASHLFRTFFSARQELPARERAGYARLPRTLGETSSQSAKLERFEPGDVGPADIEAMEARAAPRAGEELQCLSGLSHASSSSAPSSVP